jgi:NAD(P)-dependent dehydrogenase (short-subunit alcohol dehydrogenase family)
MSLNEKCVLILGGSSGIGLGVAEALLQEGASVTIVGRTQEKLRAAREFLGCGDRIKAIPADVTNEDQVALLFKESGTIDRLVVTRGVAPIGAPIESLDLDSARHFIDVMLVSALSLAKHAAPRLCRGGSITFTSGIAKRQTGNPRRRCCRRRGRLDGLSRTRARPRTRSYAGKRRLAWPGRDTYVGRDHRACKERDVGKHGKTCPRRPDCETFRHCQGLQLPSRQRTDHWHRP